MENIEINICLWNVYPYNIVLTGKSSKTPNCLKTQLDLLPLSTSSPTLVRQ